MSRYKEGASTKHRVVVHLVFCPKYRRRVLLGKVAERIRELFKECCEINEWEIHQLNVQKDHVHLLLQINPRDSIAQSVQYLKGGSSRLLRKEFPELEEFLWGDSFWGDGYFAESVGVVNEKLVKEYIQNQNKS